MSVETLSNVKAPRVRRVVALHRKKDRLATGRFLIEGPLAVAEMLVHAPELAEAVYIAETASAELAALVDDARAVGADVVWVTERVLAEMADTVQPQGVIAVGRISDTPITQALAGARLVAVLHEVRDPGNAGTVLRAADAAGADAVVFAGASIDPWHPKVVRSTTGSLFHLPVAVVPTLGEAIDAARGAGLTTLAADVRGTDLTPHDPQLTEPVAWVFGNESSGLSEGDRLKCDRALRLPLYGKAESLNLSTAASVCLYTTAFAQRQR